MEFIVSSLICIFGVSSWVTINGVFTQLSRFALALPEKWAIGTDLGLTVQLANFVAFMYFLLSMKFSVFKRYKIVISFLFVILILSTLSLAFWWDTTKEVFNTKRSVGLLAFAFLGAIVDCTSSFVYWPWIMEFRKDYTSMLGTGEALSGGVSGFIAIIQTLLDFSSKLYFIIISLLLLFSFASFWKLTHILKKEQETDIEIITPINSSIREYKIENNNTKEPSIKSYLLIIFFINFIENGAFPSILTYAFGIEGDNFSKMNWAINISFFLTPLSAAAIKLDLKLLKSRIFQSSIWIVTSGFIILASFLGKSLLFPGIGIILLSCYIICRASFAYSKTFCFSFIKNNKQNKATIGGLFTQLGSQVGSILFFILIHYTSLFKKG